MVPTTGDEGRGGRGYINHHLGDSGQLAPLYLSNRLGQTDKPRGRKGVRTSSEVDGHLGNSQYQRRRSLSADQVQLSTAASYPLDEIVQQAPGYPFLFQLYVSKDRKKSEQLLSRVSSLGMKAIFVTVDSAARGKRESDERLKTNENLIHPVTGERVKNDKKGGGLTRLMSAYIDQSLKWEDLKWIRQWTNLPIVLKGVTCAEDAKLAMQHGVEGIFLSNHGGRNLDYAPPSILLLLEMHKNCPEIFDRMEVYVDGGIRRGGDILKALCLGAKAVGMGRTFLYALNYGTEGVEHLVESKSGSVTTIDEMLTCEQYCETSWRVPCD
jgi:L-lactate dehydrogenase (cytochrome)